MIVTLEFMMMMGCNKVVAVSFIAVCVAVVCSRGVLSQNANTTAPTGNGGGLLVWTELNVATKRARINSLPANPEDYISSPTIATTGFYESTPAHWISITNDYDDRLVFWTDAARKRIMKGGLGDGATALPVFTGTSQTVDGIAVDWLANNIYWADGAYDWIMVSDYNASHTKILMDTEVDKPRGIAVYPQRGYLFWSDWGDGQKVERSNLAGENRTLVADTGLYYPNGLAVDFETDKLYWVDADPSGSRIEVCDLDGGGRRTLIAFDQGQAHLFDLVIHRDYIFASDWHEQIRCIRKSDEQQYFALNVGARPFGITVYGAGNLPGSQSPCDSSPCEHLCVTDMTPLGYQCLCSDNYVLQEDQTTCERDVAGLIMPQILMASKSSLCNFPGNFPTMPIEADHTVNCFLTNRSFAVAVDVDIPSRVMFYSDIEKKTIERVRLLQGASVDTIQAGTGSVEGLAVDWLTENIYWTDALYHHIAVSRYDGQHRNIVVQKRVVKPRSIVIHPQERVMFWTQFGPPGLIAKAGLDGKNREVILPDVIQPNGLTIDFATNRLYFADRNSGSVEHVDFNGFNRRSLYTRVGAQFFDMDIFKDYFVWTEWNSFNGIHALNRENGRVTQSLRIGTPVYGIKMYAKERQPTDGISVCGEDNGGCEHLCLPNKVAGFTCACGTGYELAEDGQSCVTNIVTDDFMLATDSYLHGIVQIFIDSQRLSYTALNLGPLTNPIAVDYDPVEGRVYWSDVKEQTINRVFLNGTGREVIAGAKDGIRIPDGIAVDPVSRLIYWTDAEQNTTSVSRLDGSRRKTLISGMDRPRAIVLDIENGYMYWSDWGDSPMIQRAYMNGTNRETIISEGLVWPNGIAIDLTEDLIYWCDAFTNKIERSTLTGENRTVMVDLGVGLDAHAFGIAVHGPYIFWTDWKKRSLMKAKKIDGSNNSTIGPDDFIRMNGIKVYSAREATATTDCARDNGNCSSLCLPTPNGAVCACQDGDSMSPDGQTCWEDLKCDTVINHGNVSSDCSVDGMCDIICDEGYRLGAPSLQVICLATGEWDIDTTYLCQVVECEPLPVPIDATALPCPSPYLYGATCSHHCDLGWEKQGGDEHRTCQGEGSWSGSALLCDVATCDPLVPPEYGSYSNSNCSTIGGYYNDLCIAQCEDGFQLMGITERGCLATGSWTDEALNSTCIDVITPVFTSACADVTVTAMRGQLQANVTYPTPTATDNSGKSVRIWSRRDEYLTPPILMDEGDYIMTFYAQDWVHNTVGCTFVITVNVIRCAELDPPTNGYYDDCQTHYGSSCTVTCSQGFELIGDGTRTCEKEGNDETYWSGQEAKCQQIECTEAQTNSFTLKAGCGPPYTPGSECIYVCMPGWVRIRGSNRRQCQLDATWSGKPLQCEIQRCNFIPAFDHGIITPNSCISYGGIFDDVCNVSCEEGFRLLGATEHQCLQSGQWSNNAQEEHACIDIKAPHFNDTCPDDFSVYAEQGDQDKIVIWTLHIADNDQNGIVNVTSSKESGSRFAEGNHTVIVRAWDSAGNMGSCEFVVTVKVARCPDLQQLPFYASPLCNNTHYGSQCSFDCEEGYTLRGNGGIDTVTCNWNHDSNNRGYWNWMVDQPRCRAVKCRQIQTPRNSRISGCAIRRQTLPYNATCSISCSPGYEGMSEDLVCGADGNWRGNRSITCEKKSCKPFEIDSTVILDPPDCLDNGVFGNRCRFSCPDGYEITGPNVRKCQKGGNWSQSDEETNCTDVTPPVFVCPATIHIFLDPCQNSTLVNLTTPIVSDNSDLPVQVLGPDDGLQIELSVGEHIMAYVALDHARNEANCEVTFDVAVRACLGFPPAQENLESLTCLHQYGSVASYRCPPGQRSVTSSDPVTCSMTGEWIGTVPECEDITCDPIQVPPHSTTTPSKCSQSPMLQGSSCFLNCDIGYAYGGLRKAVCGQDATWSTDISNVTCFDMMAPTFKNCPEGINVDLPIGSNQTVLNWAVPIATDNSGEQPTITSAMNIALPLTLGPGYAAMQYIATDSAGNSDYCLFTVTVTDREPPTVQMCPQPIVMQEDSIPAMITWFEPLFTDNIAVAKVTSDRKPGFKVYSWGRHSVRYTARDVAGNQAECVIFIDVVDSTTCLPLASPANGALACENDRYCTVHCNTGYTFTDSNRPDSAYTCLDNGFWSYGKNMERSPNLPACSKVGTDSPVNWQRRDKVQFELHHLEGNCADVEQQIQEKFLQLLSSSAFMDYCRRDPTNNCKVGNVEVQCGDTDAPKRQRRQVDETSASADQDELLSLIYNLFGQRNNSQEIDDLLTAMNMSVSDVFGSDNITLIVDGQQVMLSSQNEQTGQIQVTCDAGNTLADNGLDCVPCPVGTSYSQSSADCLPCRAGSYQDETAQTSCKQCPQYTSTASSGATTQDLCIDMCTPGQYSPSGLVQCQPCPRGTYQQIRGEKGCQPCAEGRTTRITGASTSHVCVAQDQVGSLTTPSSNVVSTSTTLDSNTNMPQTTHIDIDTSGKIDISSTPSSAVITMVSKTDKDALTSQDTPKLPENKAVKGALSINLMIGLVIGILVAVVLLGICIGVIFSKRHRRVPSGARPLSWEECDHGLMQEDDDDHNTSKYRQLEEHPDYQEMPVSEDKRFFAANAIANPAYEPTFTTFQDNRKQSGSEVDDPFGDSFKIFNPSGPLDSVELQ